MRYKYDAASLRHTPVTMLLNKVPLTLNSSICAKRFYGFDRTVYSSSNIKKKNGRRKWYEELEEERRREIQIETME
jgi:hypothetical protein